MEGYIKAYRKAIESQVFKNDGLFKVWMWCLFKASHKESCWECAVTGKGNVEVEIKKGSFVFGRNQAAKELYQKPEAVRVRMEKLKKMGNITIQSTNQYSIVTICNWGTYQGCDLDEHQPKHQPNTNQTPTKHQPNTTYKNVKNEKNVKKETNTVKNPDETMLSEEEKIFEEFRSAYKGRKRGLPTEFATFKKHKDWKSVLPLLLQALNNQINTRKADELAKRFVPQWKNLSTWLNQRCWEEESTTVSGENIVNQNSSEYPDIIGKDGYNYGHPIRHSPELRCQRGPFKSDDPEAFDKWDKESTKLINERK